MNNRRETILLTVDDLVSSFLYYNRKEDEDLPLGAIEEALENKEINLSDILTKFESCLRDGLGDSTFTHLHEAIRDIKGDTNDKRKPYC